MHSFPFDKTPVMYYNRNKSISRENCGVCCRFPGEVRSDPFMYQLAIFDLDGTLVNSIADLGGTANRLLEQRGLPTHPLDAYYHFVGNGVHKLCERCLPADTPADEVERFFAAFNEDYSRHCLDKTAPYAGIPEVLEQLRSAGVHIAVASNKTQPFVEKIVKHYFGENGFDQILGSSDSRPKKPSPEIISVILENAGMTPEQAVMIGDSNVDIRTAKNAGVHSIGCTWGFRGRDELAEAGADDLAEKPEDLLKFTLM